MTAGVLVAWPLVLTVAKLVAGVRRRFVLAFAGGWLVALVVATTAEPRARAMTIGPVIGAVGAVLGWLVIRRGLNLTWMPGKVFLRDNGPTPRAEYAAAAIIIAGLLAALLV
jgi:hypothetical protein